MSKLKNKWVVISVLSIISVLVIAYFSQGLVASWLTKETIESNVQISLLLQGDEGDLYESPVMLMSSGAYELKTEKDLAEGETTKDLVVRENLYDNLMAGVNIRKDPKVFITKKSGAEAYLYIEVIEDNFPKYFTEGGFEELAVDNESQNPNKVSPIYYYLEDFWVPVVQYDGVTPATGLNGGKLYVYYNENSYFNNYNKTFNITVGAGSEAKTLTQNATCLSSYIMKSESDSYITKKDYYGENEVKLVNGVPIKCPYFNIIKDDTIYVSEKYIHSEYYSTLYSDLKGVEGNTSETVKYDYDFGLYFNSYMASSKINGEYANPFEAFAQAQFMDEKEYLIEQYRAKDTEETLRNDTSGTPKGELSTDGRVVYVWTEEELNIAADDYFEDGAEYKIVVMDDIVLKQGVFVTSTSHFTIDMNSKTLYATSEIEENTKALNRYNTMWYQQRGANVTICGNGTFDFGEDISYGIIPYGNLTIKDGYFIRDYNPTKDENTAFNKEGIIVAAGGGAHTVIEGGYFDNGYWYLEPEGTNSNKIKDIEDFPKYDTEEGTGWIKNNDGTYKLFDTDGYALPHPRGLCSVIGITANDNSCIVKGGTFVGQNPAWGDECCAQGNKDNPWMNVFCSNKHGYFLVGQETFESAGVEYIESGIPGYTITEGNTTYSYIDDDGNLVEFYVPKYTVKYDEQAAATE